MDEILVMLDNVYKRLQTLSITTTKGNLERLIQSLYDLENINKALLKEMEKNGRQTANP